MKKSRFFPIFKHAIVMFGRTFKNYAFLSVTIVLSFSLLLGYYVYCDSTLYNRYKSLFALRWGDILIRDLHYETEKVNLFMDGLENIENTISYTVYKGTFGHHTSTYQTTQHGKAELFHLSNLNVLYIPDYAWINGYFESPLEIIWLNDSHNSEFVLEADEIILNERAYFALQLDKTECPTFKLRGTNGPNFLLKVVGYTKESYSSEQNNWTENKILLSTKIINELEVVPNDQSPLLYQRVIVIHSEHPEQVQNLARSIGFNSTYFVYQHQTEALEEMQKEKQHKALISCVLLLLLGINLYSSFSNALNDRKFEIGVKRALGASSRSIVKQFFYESFLVMLINILASIFLITNLFTLFKVLKEKTLLFGPIKTEWIIYISPYSIAMFLVCTISLTIVFSLMFAYKSTQVEIVKYLKNE